MNRPVRGLLGVAPLASLCLTLWDGALIARNPGGAPWIWPCPGAA